MPVHFHIFAFLTYSLLAAAVAMAVPMPEVAPSVLTAALVLVGGAVVHLAITQALRLRDMAEELHTLRASHFDLAREIGIARDAASRLGDSPESEAARQEVSRVVDEVRVLKKLIEQLYAKRTTASIAAPAPKAGADVEAAGKPRETAAKSRPRSGKAPPMPVVARGLDEGEVLDAVREGLKENRVDLFLQPIVSLPQRKRRFYECFSRIRLNDEAMVVPEQYLAIAEREGLIAAIDNLLLFRCVQLVRRSQKHNYNADFICNISPYNLEDRGFFREFLDFMAQNSELARNLIFEFAQQDVRRFDEDTVRLLDRLAAFGFRYSMDRVVDLDFDFRWLHDHYFVFVKVSTDILLNRVDYVPGSIDVRDLKRAFDRHNIDLVADKVETERDLLELLDLKIDFGQGYLFGEPRLSRVR